jgi:hypothetical protein
MPEDEAAAAIPVEKFTFTSRRLLGWGRRERQRKEKYVENRIRYIVSLG